MKHRRTIIALGCAWYILAFIGMDGCLVATLADIQHPRTENYDAYDETWLVKYAHFDQTLYVGPTWFSPDAKIKGCILALNGVPNVRDQMDELNVLPYFDAENKVWRTTLIWTGKKDFRVVEVVIRAFDGKVLLIDSDLPPVEAAYDTQ